MPAELLLPTWATRIKEANEAHEKALAAIASEVLGELKCAHDLSKRCSRECKLLEIFGLGSDWENATTPEEINKLSRKLKLITHPDKTSHLDDTLRGCMTELCELTDRAAKSLTDRELARPFAGGCDDTPSAPRDAVADEYASIRLKEKEQEQLESENRARVARGKQRLKKQSLEALQMLARPKFEPAAICFDRPEELMLVAGSARHICVRITNHRKCDRARLRELILTFESDANRAASVSYRLV